MTIGKGILPFLSAARALSSRLRVLPNCGYQFRDNCSYDAEQEADQEQEAEQEQEHEEGGCYSLDAAEDGCQEVDDDDNHDDDSGSQEDDDDDVEDVSDDYEEDYDEDWW